MLVEDHELTRRQMASLLEREKDLEVVAEASSGEESVGKAAEAKPDVIVMDVLLPGMSGVKACRSLVDAHHNVRLLVLSNYAGKTLVEAVLDAGALGYVRKDRAFEELIPAVRAVAAGQRYFGEKILDP
jgi:two-component system, NarL family, invasion response regulator UvrY